MMDLDSRLQRVKDSLSHPPTEKEIALMASKKNAAAPSTPANKGDAPKAAKKELDPNQISLATICKELKVVGQVARRKLRAAKMVKDGRWVFTKGSPEEKRVREILTAKEKAKDAEAA